MRELKKILRPIYYAAIAQAGKKYISGESIESALVTSTHLQSLGYNFTLGYWNGLEEEIPTIVFAYERAIEALAQVMPSNYLSLKVPAIDFNPSIYFNILNKARKANVYIHLDSHAHNQADKTLTLIADARSAPWTDIGCTLPSRWKRSLADAEFLANLGVVPRLVKGQWGDPVSPEINVDLSFLNLVKFLSGKVETIRLATHDPILLDKSISILSKTDTKIEVELLYGLPVKQLATILVQANFPTRVYIPYGQGALPYALSYIKSNPSIAWNLLKDVCLSSFKQRFPKI